MSSDQYIALFASIGACLSALATFLTIREMKKQRESSYKPELIISGVCFSASKHPVAEGVLATFWKVDGANEDGPIDLNFKLPIMNIGLGAAKDVYVEWSFPIEECVGVVNGAAGGFEEGSLFVYDDGVLMCRSEEYGRITSYWKNQDKAIFDYVLSADVKADPVMLMLPPAYITMAAAFVKVKCNKMGSMQPEFKPLGISFEYLDVSDRKCVSKFEIVLDVMVHGMDGSFFMGRLTSKKCE